MQSKALQEEQGFADAKGTQATRDQHSRATIEDILGRTRGQTTIIFSNQQESQTASAQITTFNECTARSPTIDF
jgi:hypothetical protein